MNFSPFATHAGDVYNTSMYILFDIGGTNMRLAASKDGKTFGEIKTVPTPKKFEEGIEAFKRIASELSGGEKIGAIAGGIAGPLDEKKGMAVGGPNIGGYHNKPIKSELEAAFGAPVYLENDAAMGVLGEANFGAGKGYEIVVYITISTGLGGARAVGGVLDPSAMGYEPGWQIIACSEVARDEENEGDEHCVKRGYLSHYVSGAEIEKHYGKKPSEITDETFWNERAKFLACGLNNIIVLWSPNVIVLGGSMMNQVGISLEKVRSYTQDAMRIFPRIPDIKRAQLGDELGLYGALASLKQKEGK